MTIEDVIRAQPGPSFGDMLMNHGLATEAAWFHYQVLPADGAYCIYRRRPGEPAYPEPNYAPDCAGIAATAERHARQIWESGIDFVYLDVTNVPFFSPFADVIGVRPIEVLVEEWRLLRDRGIMTPQVAVWVPVPAKKAGQESWTYTVDHLMESIYNDPRYQDLVLRDPATGRKVLFLTDHADFPVDPVKETALASNNGRLDVVPVRMWGLMPASELAAGKASWMQPCIEAGAFTTRIRADQPCAQYTTFNSPIGSVVSVSASYQIGHASLPLGASGKNEGLTLKKQFQTAFEHPYDWLLINSWNEQVAQPQANVWLDSMGDLATSMGVRTGESDGSRGWLWVDGYGYEFSRDVEPSVVDGGSVLALLRSCLRVYRLGGCGAGGASSEACCSVSDTLRLVRSVRLRDQGNGLNTHHVLTDMDNERDALVSSGVWEEVCNPIIGLPGICARSDAGLTADGPFQVFVEPGPGRV